MSCRTYIKNHWRALAFRWAFFAMVIAGFVALQGHDLTVEWPWIVMASGVLNAAWTFVA